MTAPIGEGAPSELPTALITLPPSHQWKTARNWHDFSAHCLTMRLIPSALRFIAFTLIESFSSLFASDLAISDLVWEPEAIRQGVAPDTISFRLTNLGPDALIPEEPILVRFYLSRDQVPGHPDDIPLLEIEFPVDEPANRSFVLKFDAWERSNATLPSFAVGDYHLDVLVLHEWDNVLTNNVAIRTGPVRVVPRTANAYAVLTTSEPLYRNIVLKEAKDISFNAAYGNCWRMKSQQANLTLSVLASTGGKHVIRIRHLTSGSSECEGGGFAPVNIDLNGRAIVRRFDPAVHHAGSHGFVDDSFIVDLNAGPNELKFTAADLCTSYWIQSVDVFPEPAVLRMTARPFLPTRQFALTITGRAGTWFTLFASEDFFTWSKLFSVTNFSGTFTYDQTLIPGAKQTFFNVIEN